jgi:lipopolysaccharide biosynthesis protein
MPTEPVVETFPGACTYWDYTSSSPSWKTRLLRWFSKWQREPASAWQALKPPSQQPRWFLYFLYLPDGQLSPAHRFTLRQLASEGVPLMLVCACPSGHPVLKELESHCQALYWKEVSGWDFCAYALGLAALARHSPGCDVLVMNDSVFGPFVPLVPFLEQAPWRVTGFTGNNQGENHIQSYAFIVRQLDVGLMQHMADIFDTRLRYREQQAVVICQENRLACRAAEECSVGAYWFTTSVEDSDLCLGWPRQLVEAGFPFMKRSLLGKFADVFAPAEDMRALLHSLGHPVDDHPPGARA